MALVEGLLVGPYYMALVGGSLVGPCCVAYYVVCCVVYLMFKYFIIY